MITIIIIIMIIIIALAGLSAGRPQGVFDTTSARIA